MHAAKLKTSPRLQRLLKFLRQGGAYTTRQVARGANIEAVKVQGKIAARLEKLSTNS